MKTVDTFIYVGGSLGLVGGDHDNPRLSFVRLSDYNELEAKLKRLAMDSLHDLNHLGILAEENATLKAEVEYLRGFCTRTIIPNDVLTAKVERLTKAGDAIYQSFDEFGQVDATTLKAWHAAKEDEIK